MFRNQFFSLRAICFLALMAVTFSLGAVVTSAQCTPESNKITGVVYYDIDQSGDQNIGESGIKDVQVNLYNTNGNLIKTAQTNTSGNYVLGGVNDGETYRLEFVVPESYAPTSSKNGEYLMVRNITAPSCNQKLGLVDAGVNPGGQVPRLAISQFIKGGPGINDDKAMLFEVAGQFDDRSAKRPLATKGDLGAVRSMAWKRSTKQMYLAAFIKQGAWLKDGIHDAIYRVDLSDKNHPVTSRFARLSDLGIPVVALPVTDADDCSYGDQVGYYGLGELALSGDEQKLYVVNVSGKSIIEMSSTAPNTSSTRVFFVPDPGCHGGSYQVFALEEYKGKLYVGVTCTAETSKNKADLSIHVYALDPASAVFEEVLSTSFPSEYWSDASSTEEQPQHWLTSIAFTDEGYMILGIADRKGHNYCAKTSLVKQSGDILIAAPLPNGQFRLESNGYVGPYKGSGVKNYQGPGNGEFFGEDFWILGPYYHPEISVGAVATVAGLDQVVNAVFDPLYNTFVGGVQRYSVKNGKLKGALQVYGRGEAYFGKASGIGDIEFLVGTASLEIGDYVWDDANMNGVQDAGELPLEGIQMELYDNMCHLIGKTTTNSGGRYFFNSSNVDSDLDGEMDGLDYNTDYYIRVGSDLFDITSQGYIIGSKEYVLTLQGHGQGDMASYNDSDASIQTIAGCPDLDSEGILRVHTGNVGRNDYSFDVGLHLKDTPPPPVGKKKFDLALIKTTSSAPVKAGEMIQFDIHVFNQGEVAAGNIQISDYLPDGLEFVPGLNMGWVQAGDVYQYTIVDSLSVGAEMVVPIKLKVKSNATLNNIMNVAEISAATDKFGNPVSDIDSHYDTDPSNDNGGGVGTPTDNQIDDDGTIDEDDQDAAIVPIMDLALLKKVDVLSPVKAGQEVVFTMEVYNQGNVPVEGYTLIDYLPEGYHFIPEKNTGWLPYGVNYQYEMVTPLQPGDHTSISMTVAVSETANADNLLNYAEIMSVKGQGGADWSSRDFDSTPDDDKDNDVGGNPDDLTNDNIDDHGLIDEDDQDPAYVPIFDLAIQKSNGTILGNIANENIVEFTVRVINQGNIPATHIRIMDYLPVGLRFSDSNTVANWVKVDDANYYYDVPGTIAPGQEVQVKIATNYLLDYKDIPQTNAVEIAHAENESGLPVLDFDSTPDTDPGNDALVDDVTDRRDGTDEDDHDVGVTSADWFDLALRKFTLEDLVRQGDTVPFYVQIINQGTIPADNVRIVDYIPRGLEFKKGFGWKLTDTPKTYSKVMSTTNGILPPGGILPGDSVTIRIDLIVRQDATPGIIVNYAEIAEATNADGGPEVDIDSTPDDDPGNDAGGQPGGATDNLTNAPPTMDEDDSDPAAVFLVEVTSSPTCLNNATTTSDGQFNEEISILSPSDQGWFIQSVNGLYSTTSPAPPAATVPLTTGPGGDLPFETVLNSYSSVYVLNAISIDDQPFSIVFENKYGNRVTLNSPARHYSQPKIYGLNAACKGSLQSYHTDPIPGATYLWTLDAGGTIVGATNTPTIDIQWDNVAGGPFHIGVTVHSPNGCLEPASYTVTVGDQPAMEVNCRSFIQVSLDSSGKAVIRPEGLLQGSGYDYNSFAVMLTDASGQPIAGNVLTCDYVGQMVTAKVINTCSGNSCWAKITVEDKLPPIIECFDDTLTCVVFRKYQGPRVHDNCDPNPKITFTDERIEPICDTMFVKKVTRTYIATDKYGNTSAPCTQTVYLKRLNFDSIALPPQRTVALSNPLLCKQYKKDAKGHPDPVSVGVPMYNGQPMYPKFPFYCNVSTGYVDVVLPETGCVKKYNRIWYVFEELCGSTYVRKVYNQRIEIADTTAPKIICPDNITMTTNGGYACEADVWLPVPEVTDDCSDKITVTATYPGGFIPNLTKATRVRLPVGENTIKYRVYDGCYNKDSCEIKVTVKDNTSPVAVCVKYSTVSLNEDGVVHVYASSFDAGSFDDCALDSMAVQRMDEGAPCGQQIGFGPFVEFCCADVGDTVRVIFRVWDAAGNYNDCMVRVIVQNKIPPSITCPPCLRVPCTYKFEIDKMDDYFGRVVTDKNDIRTNTLYGNNSHVLSTCIDTNLYYLREKTFKDGLATGNCDVQVKERYIDRRDQCGKGYIYRYFEATNKGGQRDVCGQYIFFYDPQPFTGADITWPLDYETNTCDSNYNVPSNLPAGYDKPTFVNDDECALVAATYVDEKYRFIASGDFCYKIVRKWTVIDWCQKYKDGSYHRWYHDQLIKVIDNVNPRITSDCGPVSKCTYDPQCKGGPLTLTASGQDDCTPEKDLQWEYHIDLYKDGVYDTVANGVGGTVSFTKNYPLGKHKIFWQFKDRCGNTVSCTQDFEIKNCKAPTAYCKNIIVNLNPMDLDRDGKCDTKMVQVWAKDLDDGSNHPCGYNLKYSFGKDTAIKSKTYQCGDDGIHNELMCVTDVNGNQACCEVTVVVQDNSGVDCCPFDIPCVKFPKDSLIYDCHASLDTAIFGVPDTKDCDFDSSRIVYRDTILAEKQDPYRCTVVSRVWNVKVYFKGKDTFAIDTQYIIIDNQFNLDSIVWPQDTVELSGCAPSIDTSITGVASWRGDYCGEVTKSFSDTDLTDTTDACQTTRRRWSVVNHCQNDETFTFDQIIITHNARAPFITVPDDLTVNAGTDSCDAFVRLAAVTVTECSDGVTITNSYNNGGADASGVYPAGTTKVIFTVTDACGQVAQDSTKVTVKDNQPPKVVCPGDTTIPCNTDISHLNNFGILSASDNCVLDSVIMDSIFNLNVCNVGTIRRTIRAVDTAGHVTTCEQVITINNPGAIDEGDITWPQDTVNLGACESISPDSTGRPVVDVSGASCSRISIVYEDSSYLASCDGGPDTCMFTQRTWTVTDSCQLGGGNGVFKHKQLIIVGNPMLNIQCPKDTTITCDQPLFPLSQFGSATFSSGCGLDSNTVDSTLNINKCNVGTVVRTFTVYDTVGNVSSCTQTITIENKNPISLGDITWPSDTVNVASCESTSPDSTGRPAVDTSKASCFDLTISYHDTMYMALCNGTDTCTYIERTWTVTDSCQYDGVNGTWSRLQLIIVSVPIIHVTCPADTTITCDKPLFPLSQFGMATATSDCGMDSMTIDSMVDVNQCNVGTVMRTFTFTDTLGNSMSCKQTITIVIDSAVTEADITWPQDTVTVDSCGLTDPGHTGMPVVDNSKASCSNVSISSVDSAFSSPQYCMALKRKWTVIDSCQLDTLTMSGIWMFTQVIQVNDTVPPVITVSVTDTVIYLDPDSCQIFVSGLTATATDNCMITGITNNSAHADSSGSSANGVYPIGVTKFFFFASDECGNTDSVMVRVEVKDTVPPAIVCHKDIEVLPDSGVITVPVDSFLWSLSDNCTPNSEIMVSFSKDDFMDTLKRYNCDSLGGLVKKIFKIMMYAKDESGNIDSCVGQFELHDRDSVCFTSSLHRSIAGLVKMESGTKLPGTKIELYGGMSRTVVTDPFGQYGFSRVPIGETYTIEPSRRGSYLDGVNTRDMVAIQRHLLGKHALESPYKIIAADVNGSKSITTADILAIRKVVLGKADAFPRGMPSWKFVDAGYEFPDANDPFLENYPEKHVIPLLSRHESVDFIGVKLGDVNGDVRLESTPVRSYYREGDKEKLSLDIQQIMENRYRLTLKIADVQHADGLQFELSFGDLGVRPAAVMFNDAIDVHPGNVNLEQLSQGNIWFSWVNSGSLSSSEANNWLMSFDVVLKPQKLKSFIRSIQLTQNRMQPELYRGELVHALILEPGSTNEEGPATGPIEFELMPNQPNPFSNNTIIRFYLNKQSDATLSILDVSGRVLYEIKSNYPAGMSEEIIQSDKLLGSGIYYYRLSLDSGTAIRKMILIK